MPKQRNHQHHRRRGPFREGLQLPVPVWFGRNRVTEYPEGWVTRPPQPFLWVKSYAIAAVVVLGLALLGGVFVWLFGGH